MSWLSSEPFREVVSRYGVSPTWEFILPVVIAAQRNLVLRGVANADTTLGARFHGRPVRLSLGRRGVHQVQLDGLVVARGDAWEAATMFYALVGWQNAAFEAEEALRRRKGGRALLRLVWAWARRDP